MLIAVASLGLAAGTAEFRWVLGSAALAVVLTMTAVIAVCRRRVAEKPARLVFLAECELATSVCAAVAPLATTVNVAAWASEHFDSKSLAYGIGLLAGPARPPSSITTSSCLPDQHHPGCAGPR